MLMSPEPTQRRESGTVSTRPQPSRLSLLALGPLYRRSGPIRRVRRALRAYGITRGLRRGFLRGRSGPVLPEALRERLLALPATTPRARVVAPRRLADGGLSWLLASPVAPLAASFVLALALSLAWGNPYQVGAATLDRVRDKASPVGARIRVEAATIANAAAELGGTTMAALPVHEIRGSRALTALLGECPDDQRPKFDRLPEGGR